MLIDEIFERYIISVNDYYVNHKQNIKFSWVHDKTICSGELGSKIVRVDRIFLIVIRCFLKSVILFAAFPKQTPETADRQTDERTDGRTEEYTARHL